MAATTGSILVLMKKNSTSRVLATGRSDTANAAGMANSSTRMVEITVANSELSRAGAAPEARTSLNCSRVGAKNSLGGLVYASASCLNAVSTIHSTGKKNTMPTTQDTMAMTTRPAELFLGRGSSGAVALGPAGAVVAVLIRLPPRFH